MAWIHPCSFHSVLHQDFHPLPLMCYYCSLYLKVVAPDGQSFVLLHLGCHDVSPGPVLKFIEVPLDIMLLHLCYNTS